MIELWYQQREKLGKKLDWLHVHDIDEYERVIENIGVYPPTWMRSSIKLILASERYTSQICRECGTKSLQKQFKPVWRVDPEDDNARIYRQSQLRDFKCSNHTGTFDRDANASANIGFNFVYWALENPEKTTWHIGQTT